MFTTHTQSLLSKEHKGALSAITAGTISIILFSLQKIIVIDIAVKGQQSYIYYKNCNTAIFHCNRYSLAYLLGCIYYTLIFVIVIDIAYS